MAYLTDSDTIKKYWYWPDTDTDTRIGAALECVHAQNKYLYLENYVEIYSWTSGWAFETIISGRGL